MKHSDYLILFFEARLKRGMLAGAFIKTLNVC